MDGTITSFVAITGATPEVAHGFLQLTNGDLERAVGLYFENPELASGVGAGVTESASRPVASAPTTRRRTNIGREDESGVIHLSDDDDDDDADFDDNDVGGTRGDRAAIEHAAAVAQEEEDAAMAKRLQEELYQGGSGGTGALDDVRAPIARTTETLVAPDLSWDGEADGDTAQRLLEQLRSRRNMPRELPRRRANAADD